MRILLILLALTLLAGCACVSVDTAFGLDGKAVSWCKAKERAKEFCSRDGELFEKYVSYQPSTHIICDQEYWELKLKENSMSDLADESVKATNKKLAGEK